MFLRYLKIKYTEEICGQFGSFDGSAYHIALLGACSDNVVSASLFVGFRYLLILMQQTVLIGLNNQTSDVQRFERQGQHSDMLST